MTLHIFSIHQLHTSCTSTVAAIARIRYLAMFCGRSYKELYKYFQELLCRSAVASSDVCFLWVHISRKFCCQVWSCYDKLSYTLWTDCVRIFTAFLSGCWYTSSQIEVYWYKKGTKEWLWLPTWHIIIILYTCIVAVPVATYNSIKIDA